MGTVVLFILFTYEGILAQDRGTRILPAKKGGASIQKSRSRKKSDSSVDDQIDRPRMLRIDAKADKNVNGPFTGQAADFGITPPISDLIEVRDGLPAWPGEVLIKNKNYNGKIVNQVPEGLKIRPEVDVLAKISREPNLLLEPQAMPGPAFSFNGILSNDLLTSFGTTSMPPDTVGDIGPNHFVQATNFGVFRVFNKATGAPITATARISTLFSGLAPTSPCRTQDNGDPIVNYDPLADRWLVSQFAVSGATDGQCIAVSTTNDPTGSWYGYFFQQPNTNFPDYPHWGIWTDAYYCATHDFNAAGTAYVEGSFWAFDRTKMIAGDPTATYVRFSRSASYGHLPIDIDGYMPPASATPAMFFEFQANEFGEAGGDGILSWEFVPNFSTPASSTFTVKPHLPVAAFDPTDVGNYVSTRNIMEQPTPATAAQSLDSVGGRHMFRIGYRNLGTVAAPINSYVTNWNVNVSGVTPNTQANHQSGIRWTELRRSSLGTMSVFDQGTHAPDPVSGSGRNRWMGSIAQDYLGNIALGFSRSGSAVGAFPDIVWAGRSGGISAAGTLNEGEATMFASTGVQQTTNGRWGDYSSMNVDPSDDCTFWYTSEWRDAAFNGTGSNNPFKWSTRIGNFKFPGCSSQPKGTIAANISVCSDNSPVSGAMVTASAGNFSRFTNASGTLLTDIIAAPATYLVTASKSGYNLASAAAVVTNGNVTTVNLCFLSPTAAEVSVSGRVTNSSGQPVKNAVVMLADSNGTSRRAITGSFGFYHFDDVASGQTYTASVVSKRYQFAPQVFTVSDDVVGVDFIGQ